METNLNNTSFYVILFSVVLLVGCFYFIYYKIKKLNETIGQIQKHLMYQQGLIEKHSVLLRNTTTSTIPNPNEMVQNLPPPLQPMENEVKKEEKEPQNEEKPNPIQTLLPMISSLMGMMNQGEEEEDEENEEENEEEERKTEMVKEIEKELGELKQIEKELPAEGRIEEDV